MDLGAFSISLAVQDLQASKAFYEKLGFQATGGDAEQGWLILVNGRSVIGLFQGMFDKNILTFNPGLDPVEGMTETFTDVRAIREALVGAGVEMTEDNTQETDSGPAHIAFLDPDGNPVLIDQHR